METDRARRRTLQESLTLSLTHTLTRTLKVTAFTRVSLSHSLAHSHSHSHSQTRSHTRRHTFKQTRTQWARCRTHSTLSHTHHAHTRTHPRARAPTCTRARMAPQANTMAAAQRDVMSSKHKSPSLCFPGGCEQQPSCAHLALAASTADTTSMKQQRMRLLSVALVGAGLTGDSIPVHGRDGGMGQPLRCPKMSTTRLRPCGPGHLSSFTSRSTTHAPAFIASNNIAGPLVGQRARQPTVHSDGGGGQGEDKHHVEQTLPKTTPQG